jgi:hypothetical protein
MVELEVAVDAAPGSLGGYLFFSERDRGVRHDREPRIGAIAADPTTCRPRPSACVRGGGLRIIGSGTVRRGPGGAEPSRLSRPHGASLDATHGRQSNG